MTAGSNRDPSENTERSDASRAPLAAPELWRRIRETSEHALRVGALETIETDCEVVEDSGVAFIVRVARGLERKRRAGEQRPAGHNPFLPYEPDLFVADLGASHVCLLNKFRVLEQHALIVTRTFETQESLLSPADLQALAACLAEIDGLGFYNAGAIAGASQPHKHLQLVPTPLGAGGRVPIEALLPLARLGTQPAALVESTDLPLRHALIRIDDCVGDAASNATTELHARYRTLLEAMGCDVAPLRPYNLLATRDWMLLVPRRCESSAGIEVNSLGLAGALFARDADQLRTLRARGPMRMLRDVTLPRD